MNREIKFRGIDADRGDWVYGFLIKYITGYCEICYQEEVTSLKTLVKRRVLPETVGQFTGLQDKSLLEEIYEGDIVSLEGKKIGNQYENTELLKDVTNLLITEMGCKKWNDTEQEARKRGCEYAQ